MRKRILLFALLLGQVSLWAGITTYTFTSEKWASKQGTVAMDGKTDGWQSDQDGLQYDKPQHQYQTGVKVTSNYSGAGATSIQSFTNVRRVTLNYATTTSGRGSFRIQIGDNTPIDSTVTISTINRDLTVILPEEQSGRIHITVTCNKNSIWLASVAIRSEGGGSPVFTQPTYQLVTDVHQLRDSDQLIIGVADGKTNLIMGYYDELISQNNIHAIKGQYNTERTSVNDNADAVYTLWKETGETNQDTVYILQDELRYEQAYLVASGGRTKNKLTLWTDVVSPSYGNFGFWRITVSDNGEAIIENAGTSERKYMQYNATDKLFGCYADANSQTKVCLYRKTEAIGLDQPAIVAPLVNFGNIRLDSTSVTGSKTIEVNANLLTQDITCTLKSGASSVFTLSASTLDRDGDNLTITYSAAAAGKYTDTLILTSGEVTTEVSVLLNIGKPLTVAEAVQAKDFDLIYLNPVVVTKKYDTYVFVRDKTGAMLIYDAVNPQTDKPYAQGLENGHVLGNVQGRFRNYFGVPELTPTDAWTVAAQKQTCEPETVTTVDSSDVCRYVHLTDVVVKYGLWQGIPVVEKFQTGNVIQDLPTTLDAIVYIARDELQLWVVHQEYTPTDINDVTQGRTPDFHKYIREGRLYFHHNGHRYNANGQIIK